MVKEKIMSTDLCLMSVPSSAVDPMSFSEMVSMNQVVKQSVDFWVLPPVL